MLFDRRSALTGRHQRNADCGMRNVTPETSETVGEDLDPPTHSKNKSRSAGRLAGFTADSRTNSAAASDRPTTLASTGNFWLRLVAAFPERSTHWLQGSRESLWRDRSPWGAIRPGELLGFHNFYRPDHPGSCAER